MTSLYSKEIKHYIFTRQWPKGLIVDIKEVFDELDRPLYLQFVLFRDNFNRFDGVDQERIANGVRECMEKIRADGIPIYLQVAKGDGHGPAGNSLAE